MYKRQTYEYDMSSRVLGRTTGWGRMPYLIQYILSMIGVSAEEYYRKIGNNEIGAIAGTVMVP